MKQKTAYFALLLVLVLAIAVLSVTVIRRREPEAPVVTDAPVLTPAPPVEETAAPAPVETAPPTPTVQPTEPPVMETRPPIETPAPTPVPTPSPAATGSIASSTGTGLNVKADWRIYDAGGTAKLQVDVSALSYSLFTDALYQSVILTVGGSTYSANSAAIHYDGEAMAATPIASFTLNAPASGTPISLVWQYRGSYSGQELDEITASGTIYY